MRYLSVVRWLITIVLFCSGPASGNDGAIALPDWFESNRVQAHSEQSLERTLGMTVEAHTRAIADLGANALTRIVLNRDEGAWWPSSVGETNPLIGDRDVLAEIVAAVHGHGMKLVGYHRHMSDHAMQTQHPDWICRHPDGSLVLEPRSKTGDVNVLCLNSPYRDYIQTRLLELAVHGVDCIYFDSWHMPTVCGCGSCQELFRRERGHAMSLSAPEGSPTWWEMADFSNRSVVRAFRQWREAVRARYPKVFFAISSSRYPMFFVPQIDENLLAISDTSKTEYHKPFGGPAQLAGRMRREIPDFAVPDWDDQTALGWSLVRDASAGRPPLMWIPFIRSEKTSLYAASAAVAYGCIASMSITLRTLPADALQAQRVFTSTFEMGRKVSSSLAYARPIPWAALHISEQARNRRYPDSQPMWREVFGPALGALAALKQTHVPWVTLTDGALARGPDERTRTLILPWPEELSPQQREATRAYEQRGGHVIRLDAGAVWHTRDGKAKYVADLAGRLQQESASAPIKADGPPAMHAVFYQQPDAHGYTACLVNTWGWFEPTREPDPERNEGHEPPPCRDVTLLLSHALGRPRRVRDALTGVDLAWTPTSKGVRVQLPTFQIAAWVDIEMQQP